MDEDLLRILRTATHWARGASNEFDARVAECLGSLAAHHEKDGAVTLQGRTDAGAVVSIALICAEGRYAVALRRCQPVAEDGFAAIIDMQHSLTLPRYLARQLGDVLARRSQPQPEQVPA